MTTESATSTVGPSLSPEETAFFESGGTTQISETGADDAGNGSDGSGSPAGGADGAPAGDQGKPGGDTKEPAHVPLAALHEERNKRKAIDKQYRETERQLAELKGKFSIIDRLVPGGAPQDGGEPAKPKGPIKAEDDVFGAVNSQGESLAQIQKRLDDADAATKTANDNATLTSNYRSDVATFTAKTPDFMDAYNHVLNSRAQELLAIGYTDPADPTLTPEEKEDAARTLHNAIVADEQAIVQMALAKKKSPAEILYGLAKQRGYVAKAAAAGDGKPAGESGKGAAKLDAIEKGQLEHKSLSATGGSSGEPGMTAERLLAMDLGEFEEWSAKNPAAARRIMGG